MSDLLALKIGALWRAFWTESLAFKLCCVYLMFEYVRPQTIYTWLDFAPWAQMSLLAAAMLGWRESVADGRPIHGSSFGLLGAYLAVAALSMAISGTPQNGWDDLQLIIAWLIAVYAISRCVTTENRLFIFYLLFLLFSLKMSQHGFRSWASRGFGWDRYGVTGAPGWFHNSGEVGIQMCVFFPMAWYFIANGWRHWNLPRRLIALVVPVTILGTVLGTSSRGAVVGIGAVLLWMAMTSGRRMVVALVAGALVAFVAWQFMPPEFVARFDTAGTDNTSVTRLTYWGFGWQAAKDHPLFGIGLGNWIEVYTKHQMASGGLVTSQLPHNIMIQAVSELGFTGLLILLAIVVKIFALNFRTRGMAERLGNGFLRSCALGLNASMVGFLVSGQFVSVLYYPYLWIGLALTIALYNVTCRIQEQAGTQR
jgi:putative inorganic carbon (HCO3(-)) transporter